MKINEGEQIKKLYTDAGLTPPEGKGIHTLVFHQCAVNYMKNGIEKNEAYKRCMGALGVEKAVNPSHKNKESWNEDYIKSLPDSSFACLAEGIRYFPYKNENGKIDVIQLKKAIETATDSLYAHLAMPALKAAAKKVKIAEYADNWEGGEGIFRANIRITDFSEEMKHLGEKGKPNDEKKEVVLPLLVEGWGNPVDNNYYTTKAVAEAASYLASRRKMYFNHAKNDVDERDIRDWGASIQETWTSKTQSGEKSITWGKVKIYDKWLWERYKDAPDEIGTSLMGRGRARKGEVDGREGNVIESIEYVKSCDFVDYPGNVPLGMAYFVENENGGRDKNKPNREDTEMNFNELTVTILKENRSDLVTQIETAISEASKKKVDELEAKTKEKDSEVSNLKTKVDAYELKERTAIAMAEKEKIISKCINESKLPDTAKTPIFMEMLHKAEEYKAMKDGKEITVTIEDQVKTLISDRETILGIKEGVKGMGHSKGVGVDSEAQEAFNVGIMGIQEKKKDEQK